MTKTKTSKPGQEIQMRSPTSGDAEGILAFAGDLPAHDLLYLRRDITQRPVVEAWLAGVADGSVQSLLALSEGKIVGTSALVLDKKSWSPHVGEIRVLVGEAARGKGVGRMLIQETFALALEQGLAKIIAQMTIDQTAARGVFEEMGFAAEALLKDHVRDPSGTDHDILILSCDVAGAQSRMKMSR